MKTAIHLFLFAALGCGVPRIHVHLAPSDDVRARTVEVRVRAYRVTAEGAVESIFDERRPAGDAAWAGTVPLAARTDARRVEVVAEAFDGSGALVADARALASLPDAGVHHLLLRLDEACARVRCPSAETCRAGACESVCVVPTPLASDAPPAVECPGDLPLLCGECAECGRCVAGTCEPRPDGSPCGCDDDACLGRECVPDREVLRIAVGRTHSCAVPRQLDLLLQTEPGWAEPCATEDATCGGDRVGCCARLVERVFCWGEAALLGGAPSGRGPALVALREDAARGVTLQTVEGVDAGARHACAILSDDSLYCWGDDTAGQLGATPATPGAPVRIGRPDTPRGALGFRAVAAGVEHTCAARRIDPTDVESAHELVCWGENASGALGRGGIEAGVLGVDVVGALPSAVFGALATGGRSTCVDAGASLYCWGEGSDGQLGAPAGDRGTPGETPGGSFAVDVDQWLACRIRADDRGLECRGSARGGRLGDGVGEDRVQPDFVEPIVPGAGARFRSIAVAEHHACAVTEDERLFCWGSDERGQLGTSRPSAETRPPTQVPGRFVEVAADGETTCAIDVVGGLFCWGANDEGQAVPALDASDVPAPTRVCLPRYRP